jgi:GNAT superfamily N-acetyltransferase
LADLQISWLLRGKGIGTKILWIIETIVKKKKYNKLKLKVFFDNPAVNLYKRLGYNILEKESERFLMVKYI